MVLDSFINSYKNKLTSLIDMIDNDKIKEIINLLIDTEKNGSNIYIMGNGGSAATASHMVNDLGYGLSRRGFRNFRVQSLSDNVSVCTALSNDVGYENIFYEQIRNKLNKNDLVIAISCSGNSENIVKAVEYANKLNIKVIGITGFDGGKLKNLSTVNLHVQTQIGEYGLVEDLHMVFNHMIYSYFIDIGKY